MRLRAAARNLGRQLFASLVALVVSTVVVFGAMYVAPGDTLKFLSGGRTLSPEAVDSYRQQFHLDDPLPQRYGKWLWDAMQGDFGDSLVTRTPVSDMLAPRLGTTFLLLAMAAVLVMVGGVALGLLAGLSGRRTDTAVSIFVSFGMALPQFVVAALLTAVFAVELGWLPVYGSGEGLGDEMRHLILPSIALALGSMAYVARISRVAVREEESREHVETARTRGLSGTTVVRRHVLRNALVPITTVTGLSIAGLIASSVVVENAFGLNGLGSLLVESVLAKDFAAVQAISLILVVLFLIVNLVVDLLYAALDPRLRGAAPR